MATAARRATNAPVASAASRHASVAMCASVRLLRYFVSETTPLPLRVFLLRPAKQQRAHTVRHIKLKYLDVVRDLSQQACRSGHTTLLSTHMTRGLQRVTTFPALTG